MSVAFDMSISNRVVPCTLEMGYLFFLVMMDSFDISGVRENVGIGY